MIDFNEIKCYRCGEKGHFSCGVIDSTPREEELSKRITDAELRANKAEESLDRVLKQNSRLMKEMFKL